MALHLCVHLFVSARLAYSVHVTIPQFSKTRGGATCASALPAVTVPAKAKAVTDTPMARAVQRSARDCVMANLSSEGGDWRRPCPVTGNDDYISGTQLSITGSTPSTPAATASTASTVTAPRTSSPASSATVDASRTILYNRAATSG